jgi:hypothetical protein
MKVHISKWLFLLVLAPLAYFLFMPVYYAKTQEQSTLGNYLMGGFILVTVAVFMVDQIIQHHRNRKEEQKKHSLELNEIYKRISHVGFQTQGQNRSEIMLNFPRNYYLNPTPILSPNSDRVQRSMDNTFLNLPLQSMFPYDQLEFHPEYENFEFAIEHLKNSEYENIYKHWENVWKIINGYKGDSEPLLDQLKGELDSFSTELKTLIANLKAGNQIKGKCPKCP